VGYVKKNFYLHHQPLPQQLLYVCVLAVCLFSSSTVVVVTLLTGRQEGKKASRYEGRQTDRLMYSKADEKT
jgi:hypothetical protein